MTILIGKFAYFGLDVCINIVLNPLWAIQERQVLVLYIWRDIILWKQAWITSAQASDDVGSTIDPTSSMPIFKRLYLIIYKTLALTVSVLVTECSELFACLFSYQNRRGLNRPILRPLWLMMSAAADAISVPSVHYAMYSVIWTVSVNTFLLLGTKRIGWYFRQSRSIQTSSILIGMQTWWAA